MIAANGLLAAMAFSLEEKRDGLQRPGYAAIFDAIAAHLESSEISITNGTSSAKDLIKFLVDSDSQTLKLATAEAMEWLSYARRFVRPD
jgi:CRISPR/Cas system CMR-associated protein Cmr5 small subunit